jgi:hypothetical protein
MSQDFHADIMFRKSMSYTRFSCDYLFSMLAWSTRFSCGYYVQDFDVIYKIFMWISLQHVGIIYNIFMRIFCSELLYHCQDIGVDPLMRISVQFTWISYECDVQTFYLQGFHTNIIFRISVTMHIVFRMIMFRILMLWSRFSYEYHPEDFTFLHLHVNTMLLISVSILQAHRI